LSVFINAPSLAGRLPVRNEGLRDMVSEMAHKAVSSLLSYLGQAAQLERCAPHLLCRARQFLPGVKVSAEACTAAQQECSGYR